MKGVTIKSMSTNDRLMAGRRGRKSLTEDMVSSLEDRATKSSPSCLWDFGNVLLAYLFHHFQNEDAMSSCQLHTGGTHGMKHTQPLQSQCQSVITVYTSFRCTVEFCNIVDISNTSWVENQASNSQEFTHVSDTT